MKSTNRLTRADWRIRGFVTAICLIAVTLLFPASAEAGMMLHTSAVPAGQVIENDVFLTGEKPVVEGAVNGNVFIVGSDVTISGEVNGSVFVMAERLTLPGRVHGGLYAAAVELTQPADGQIGQSLYALTLSLVTEPESVIGRDLTTVAMSARLRGQTGRDTTAVIGPWELFKLLREGITQNITGYVPGQLASVKSGPQHVSVRSSSPRRAMLRMVQRVRRSALVDWLVAAARALVKFLIVGGLMLWAFPRQFQGWAEKVRKEPLASAGYGAVVLINGYLVPGLMLFLLLGLLFGLIYLSLPALAWIFFWAGLGTLMTLFTLFLAAVTFLSKAIVAYLAGTFILSRVAPTTVRYPVIPLLLGLLIYVPLASIPYLGFFIGLVVTLLGLGSIWLSRKQISQWSETRVEPVSI